MTYCDNLSLINHMEGEAIILQKLRYSFPEDDQKYFDLSLNIFFDTIK